ncbi:hypothetical protein ACFVP8_20285 [Viridibacillus arvi]|uniref:hypothetical protein n=1 Tax=Viridibacillus arvi TaxID=263475 RepID=UPI0036AAACA3
MNTCIYCNDSYGDYFDDNGEDASYNSGFCSASCEQAHDEEERRENEEEERRLQDEEEEEEEDERRRRDGEDEVKRWRREDEKERREWEERKGTTSIRSQKSSRPPLSAEQQAQRKRWGEQWSKRKRREERKKDRMRAYPRFAITLLFSLIAIVFSFSEELGSFQVCFWIIAVYWSLKSLSASVFGDSDRISRFMLVLGYLALHIAIAFLALS